MLEIQSTFYTPVLRLKQGEYLGLAGLAEDVKACILPHLILPPRMERDPEKERPLTPDELISETTKRIGTCWAVRPCLVDTRFFDGASDGGSAESWLPRLFDAIERNRGRAIPVAHLSMNSEEQHGIRSIVRKQRHGLLRVTLSDLAESSVTTKIQHFLLAVTAEPRETILLLDFADASFDDPEAIADLIAELEAVGKWARLVFEGTHYPSTNPAPMNGIARVRRNEWLAWRHSVEAHPELRRTLMFGD